MHKLCSIKATPLWCDNEACVTVSKDASAMKRMAYVARRVRWSAGNGGPGAR